MKTPRARSFSAAGRRRRARARLGVQPSAPAPAFGKDHRRLLHELHVHQIELEQQNQELAQAQAALEASAVKYADLYDSAPVSYLTLQPDSTIVEVNLTAANYLGIVRRLLIGRRFGFFVTPDTRPAFYAFLQNVGKRGTASTCEVALKLERRGMRQVCLHAGPAPAKAGGAPLFRVVLEDITERKRADTLLRESEEWLRLAARASSVGLWDWNLRTNEVTYSREWKQQLGYEEHEIGNTLAEWRQRVHPDDLAAAIKRLRNYLARPTVAHEAEVFQKKFGITRQEAGIKPS